VERSEHIAESIELYEGKKAQVAPLDKPHDRGRPNQGINAAVRGLGIADRSRRARDLWDGQGEACEEVR
jgi:hypothetical protein